MSNLIAFFTVETSDERFVSGSVDKTAIVWKKDGDYEVRYGQLLCSLNQDSYKCLAGTSPSLFLIPEFVQFIRNFDTKLYLLKMSLSVLCSHFMVTLGISVATFGSIVPISYWFHFFWLFDTESTSEWTYPYKNIMHTNCFLTVECIYM